MSSVAICLVAPVVPVPSDCKVIELNELPIGRKMLPVRVDLRHVCKFLQTRDIRVNALNGLDDGIMSVQVYKKLNRLAIIYRIVPIFGFLGLPLVAKASLRR